MIEHEPTIATTRWGERVDAYTLATPTLRMRVLTLGGTITHLWTPDRDGSAGDVTLGFDGIDGYQADKSPYLGALIGRVGNRIDGGRFSLEGKSYQLATNDNGVHHLHGGARGYDKRVWTATPDETPEGPTLHLALFDPDGSEGYPGALDVAVTYSLVGDTLRIHYVATARGAATPVNLTHHAYFNLRDAGASDVRGHVLRIDADRYTPVNDKLIPTGEVAGLAGTPLDFRQPKPIGRDLDAVPAAAPGGFDHNFVLSAGEGLRRAARVAEPTTGRTMECWTTEPAVQFYSGNFLDGSAVGKGGQRYAKHAGFCLETQRYPDSVNQPNFPSTILAPGKTYRSTTEYRFGVER